MDLCKMAFLASPCWNRREFHKSPFPARTQSADRIIAKLILGVIFTAGIGLAQVTTATLAAGLAAWGTTLHADPSAGYDTIEAPFTASTLSQSELASIGGRCAGILGNGSGFGVCNSCRAGALGSTKLPQ